MYKIISFCYNEKKIIAVFDTEGERMEKAKVIELKETILEDNNADAQVLRQELKAQKTCLMNLMSSPGSGKTSTLSALKPYFEGKSSGV